MDMYGSMWLAAFVPLPVQMMSLQNFKNIITTVPRNTSLWERGCCGYCSTPTVWMGCWNILKHPVLEYTKCTQCWRTRARSWVHFFLDSDSDKEDSDSVGRTRTQTIELPTFSKYVSWTEILEKVTNLYNRRVTCLYTTNNRVRH